MEFEPEVIRRSAYGENPEVGDRARRTYARILEASLRVFARQGFQDATMHDVARAADVARATVYQYFESKQHIVDALAARINHELRLLIDELDPLDASVESRARLRTWLEQLMRITSAYAPVIEVWMNAAAPTTELAERNERWGGRLGTDLGRRLRSDGADAAPIARALYGVVEALSLRAASGELTEPMDGLLDGLAVVTHRGLFPRTS